MPASRSIPYGPTRIDDPASSQPNFRNCPSVEVPARLSRSSQNTLPLTNCKYTIVAPTDQVVVEDTSALITTNQCKRLVQEPDSSFIRAWTSNGKTERPSDFTRFHKGIHKSIRSRRRGRADTGNRPL